MPIEGAMGAAFVDVGMGLELDEGSLGGILRVTASTPEKRDHASQRISFMRGDNEDIYASNIQVADLNALNECCPRGCEVEENPRILPRP